MDSLTQFVNISKEEFFRVSDSVDEAALKKAADIIIAAKERGNRLHVTGIGKTAHVATYAAASIASTGTPAYYLHGTEAVHGSCGQLMNGDVVICISNSGETAELKAAVNAVKNNGCHVIAVTGNTESWLAKNGEVCLKAGVNREGGVLNRAPRASIIAEIFVMQCLSVLLQDAADMTPEKYIKCHPGGALGKLRENEK